jgi:hypothetical protein
MEVNGQLHALAKKFGTLNKVQSSDFNYCSEKEVLSLL